MELSSDETVGPLQDLRLFNAVELDPAFGTIQRANGANFDAETLHDWPKYRDEFVATFISSRFS